MGRVEEIFGTINEVVGVNNVCACNFSICKQKFTVKLSDGVKASSYKKGTSDFK